MDRRSDVLGVPNMKLLKSICWAGEQTPRCLRCRAAKRLLGAPNARAAGAVQVSPLADPQGASA